MPPQGPEHHDVPGVGLQGPFVVAPGGLVVSQLLVELGGRREQSCARRTDGAVGQSLEQLDASTLRGRRVTDERQSLVARRMLEDRALRGLRSGIRRVRRVADALRLRARLRFDEGVEKRGDRILVEIERRSIRLAIRRRQVVFSHRSSTERIRRRARIEEGRGRV